MIVYRGIHRVSKKTSKRCRIPQLTTSVRPVGQKSQWRQSWRNLERESWRIHGRILWSFQLIHSPPANHSLIHSGYQAFPRLSPLGSQTQRDWVLGQDHSRHRWRGAAAQTDRRKLHVGGMAGVTGVTVLSDTCTHTEPTPPYCLLSLLLFLFVFQKFNYSSQCPGCSARNPLQDKAAKSACSQSLGCCKS